MRRLQSALRDQRVAHGNSIAVDANVPRGFAHTCYEIDGFDTAYNPLAKTQRGRRIRQTTLPIVFESGLEKEEADGVKVESILAVCSDHLATRLHTPQAKASYQKASELIRRAIDLLVEEEGESQP